MRAVCFVLLAAIALSGRTAQALQAGDFDPTFNGGQPLLVDVVRTVPRSASFTAVAFDAVGNLILTGYATDGDGRIAVVLVRVTPNGAVDTSFADSGSRVVQLGQGSGMIFSRGWTIGARSGGGWLVGGASSGADGRAGMLAAAFDANGALDTGYAGGSVRPQPAGATQLGSYASGGDVTPDGSTIIAGAVLTDASNTRLLAVTKVGADGVPAADFGNQGTKGAYLASFSQSATSPTTGAADALVTPDGILVTGDTLDSNDRGQLLLLRMTPSGVLDSHFGTGGVVRLQVGDGPVPGSYQSGGTAIALGPDGKVYVIGEATNADLKLALSITRFTPTGQPDGGFGTNGTRRFQPASASHSTFAGDVAVQADGRALLLGAVGTDDHGSSAIVLLRVETDGDLDGTFANGGVFRLDAGNTYGEALAVSPDGQSVVVAGALASDGSVGKGLVTRILLAAPTTTTTLPSGCAAVPSVPGARCRVARIGDEVGALVPDGKLRQRLLRGLGHAGDRLAAAEPLADRAWRRALRKAAARLRRAGRLLQSKAAERVLGDQRAALAAETAAVVSELEALVRA